MDGVLTFLLSDITYGLIPDIPLDVGAEADMLFNLKQLDDLEPGFYLKI